MLTKSPDTVRILHISDLHAGLRDFSARYLFDKRLFGRTNQMVFRQKGISRATVDALAAQLPEINPDYLVCTGDLTSIGSQAEFKQALDWLAPILNAVPQDHFLYVPGNHDAYVPANRNALADFLEQFTALNGKSSVRLEQDGFDIILINAARPCAVYLSTGELSRSAWDELDAQIAARRKGVPLLLACHFPWCYVNGRPLTWRTHLNNWQTLRDWACAKRFDAQLCGHVHRPFIHQTAPEGSLVVGSGSLTLFHSYAIIDIRRTTGEIIPSINTIRK